MHEANNTITAVILAGGQGKRMGGENKALIALNHKNFIENAIEKLEKQTQSIIINANQTLDLPRTYPYPICPDTITGFQGPLAGILTAMEWTQKNKPNHHFILSVAVDTPFFPDNLIDRLYQKQKQDHADIVLAQSNGKIHPVFGLWRVLLARNLRDAIENHNIRKIRLWSDKQKWTTQSFDTKNGDPFFNANTPEDKEKAQRMSITKNIKPLFKNTYNIPVIGIMGYKNAGKTTLIEKLITALSNRNYRIATIKHAHHHFDIDHENRDSYRHRQAGAKHVLITSKKRWALIAEVAEHNELSFEDATAKINHADLIIVEGFKNASYPKIKLHGGNIPKINPQQGHDPNIIAHIYPDQESLHNAQKTPAFHRDDIPALADFITLYLKTER